MRTGRAERKQTMKINENPKRLRISLQYFAEPNEDGGNDPENDGGGSDTNPAGGGEGNKPQSFDDVLKNKDYQAEFDRRVQQAITKAKDKWNALLDDKLSESEKLAKMNKEEKAEYLRQKSEKELAAREAAVTKRELMAEAKVTLADEKLPVSLAELLNYTDADACKASIETMKKAFQEAVSAAVQEKLKGGTPPRSVPQEDEEMKNQIYKNLMGQ